MIKAVRVVFCTDYFCIFHNSLSVKGGTMGGGCMLFGIAVSKVHCKASSQHKIGERRPLDKVVVVWPIHVLFRNSQSSMLVILANDVRFFHVGNGGSPG